MTDWGGNYPPGAKNDPRAPYNQPDRSHEHQWGPTEPHVVVEDGAAVFHQRCNYAEGPHGEGWQCEETRSYRFEYSYIENGAGNRIEIPTIEDWDRFKSASPLVAQQVIRIENHFRDFGPGHGVSLGYVDPDPEAGSVRLDSDGWTLVFEP